VFGIPEDPVKLGLVASLARPGGNMTGINFFAGELLAKRLELLRELVPKALRVAVFVNPANPARAETQVNELQTAARVGRAAHHHRRCACRRGNRDPAVPTGHRPCGRERHSAACAVAQTCRKSSIGRARSKSIR
jgi:ABC transporter substrate binding protein